MQVLAQTIGQAPREQKEELLQALDRWLHEPGCRRVILW
jgi:hypothetical protein